MSEELTREENKMYVRFVATHKDGEIGEALWGHEFDKENVITVVRAREILAEAEEMANKRFNRISNFYKESIIINKHKTVTYNSKTNTLRVWVDDMPIYENADGIICNDPVALADCLL